MDLMYTALYIKSSQTAGSPPSPSTPPSPSLFPGFRNVSLVKGHVLKEKRRSESAWGSATDCEKEIFFPSLHVKIELLLRQTGSLKIYTHKHTKSNVCWLNQASLKHTAAHTPATITHSLNIPDGAFSHPVKVGDCCWGTSTTDRFQLCFLLSCAIAWSTPFAI